jgi:hypothetical protein
MEENRIRKWGGIRFKKMRKESINISMIKMEEEKELEEGRKKLKKLLDKYENIFGKLEEAKVLPVEIRMKERAQPV